MSVLRNIEHKLEGLFEGVFGRAFRTHVQPVVLAAAAVAIPHVRARGPWWIAGLGAALIAAALLPAPAVAAAPLVLAAWVTCTVLALRARG